MLGILTPRCDGMTALAISDVTGWKRIFMGIGVAIGESSERSFIASKNYRCCNMLAGS